MDARDVLQRTSSFCPTTCWYILPISRSISINRTVTLLQRQTTTQSPSGTFYTYSAFYILQPQQYSIVSTRHESQVINFILRSTWFWQNWGLLFPGSLIPTCIVYARLQRYKATNMQHIPFIVMISSQAIKPPPLLSMSPLRFTDFVTLFSTCHGSVFRHTAC